MNRTLLGVRGLETPEQNEKLITALKLLPGVRAARAADKGQLEVEYDPVELTIMDLIRTIREQGFLAGML